MTVAIDIGTLIVSTPGICGGRPRIAGTRVSVQNIAIDYRSGMTPEEISNSRLNLNLAQIYAALAYYHANKKQIEADIDAYYKECEFWEAEWREGKL